MYGFAFSKKKTYLLMQHNFEYSRSKQLATALKRSPRQTGDRQLLLYSFRGGSRIFFRRGCTRLLLYFNTNKPHSFFFFLQNTSCIRKPQVISGGRGGGGGVHTPCTLSLDPPLSLVHIVNNKRIDFVVPVVTGEL